MLKAKEKARLEELKAKGAEITPDEQAELNLLLAKAESEAPPQNEEPTPDPLDFDKENATFVVTHRDGPKKVWFRDGKEIGVEDAD